LPLLAIGCLTGGLRLTIGFGLRRSLTLTFCCFSSSLCLPVGLCLRRCLTLAVSFYSRRLLGRTAAALLLHLRLKQGLPVAFRIRRAVVTGLGSRSRATGALRRTRRTRGCVV
jgi:hypothetical protein